MISKLSSMIGMRTLPAQRFAVQKRTRKRTRHSSNDPKQLLIDVSVIVREDAHTGIQRVVRGLLLQLFKHSPHGYRIAPVYCTRKTPYRYAGKSFVERFDPTAEALSSGNVTVSPGDIFFGLDLTAHLLPYHYDELLQWKQQGVKIHVLVYDMLPHLHPEWFTPRSVKNFRRWLRTIAIYGDKLICISETVKKELKSWLKEQGFSAHTPVVTTIPMGSEIASSLPNCGTDAETAELIEHLKNQKFILMVGTIEPRKGYADALDAMETIWDKGDETSLVIIGKPGWKTIKLQERLMTHPQAGKKFFWLKNVSDQILEKLYKMANGVLVASHGEGFGLPIIEAMYYGKTLIVRDIPVFHEVAEKYKKIHYFSSNEFLHKHIQNLSVQSDIDEISWLETWENSYLTLKKVMGVEK